jgi:hypothetical protein
VVYDGRLVVDHHFTATDPAILGAGSVAKFSRRYRAPLPMQQYSSREAGEAVARALLQRLHPGADVDALSPAAVARDLSATAAPSALLPEFRKPKLTAALLPGSLHYFHARLPVFELGVGGRELVTTVPSAAPAATAGGGTAASTLPARYT